LDDATSSSLDDAWDVVSKGAAEDVACVASVAEPLDSAGSGSSSTSEVSKGSSASKDGSVEVDSTAGMLTVETSDSEVGEDDSDIGNGGDEVVLSVVEFSEELSVEDDSDGFCSGEDVVDATDEVGGTDEVDGASDEGFLGLSVDRVDETVGSVIISEEIGIFVTKGSVLSSVLLACFSV
jgi:hypothetical protein